MSIQLADSAFTLLSISFTFLKEASYAYKLGKQIIPLMMEENYEPDGWLGLILGTKLYMHFEKDHQEGIQQLLKEITNVTAAGMC